MPRDLDMDFEFQEEGMAPVRPRRQAPSGMPSGPSHGARRKKNNTTSIIILAVEVVVLIALVVLFFVLKSKIQGGSGDTGAATQTEQSAEGSGSSGGVNVESDSFTLTCTKVQLATDVNGNPAAMIYFTFVNKTDTPLSMNEVFPPSLKQTGMDCTSDPQLAEYPAEYSNKDMQVSSGQSVECCYAFSIYDLTSPLTLTIRDNYSTFTDIGSTEIPIS